MSRFAQLQFALHFTKKFLDQKRLHPHSPQSLIPSHYFLGDVIKLALHWRIHYCSQTEYKKWGIGETLMGRIIEWSRLFVCSIT